jgi:hypothetical protein
MTKSTWLNLTRIEQLHARQRTIDMLEDLAPQLCRINPCAAETAWKIQQRLRLINDFTQIIGH